MPQATLDAIRKKIRRLTRSPSDAQLTVDDLDEYINTFVLYDFPQRIQTIELRKNIAFFTQAREDRYDQVPLIMSLDQVQGAVGVTGSSFPTTTNYFDLGRDIIYADQPVYIAGREAYVTESRTEFYRMHPQNIETRDTGLRGDGAQITFNDFLTGSALQDNVSILKRNVTITAQDVNGNTIIVYDDGQGRLAGNIGAGANTIDYETGEFDVTFSLVPDNNAIIYVEFARERLNRPTTLLFFNNGIYIRPVPDKGYRIEFEAQVRPARLLEDNQVPDIAQWWQYIAFGAAKKIFEDRMDMESVALIQPEMDNQERFILRNTILQAKKQRSATIYTGLYDGHGHDGVP